MCGIVLGWVDVPVLLVEDDPAIQATVADVLDFAGYPVALASNGTEALVQIDHGLEPCVILLDMRMPVLDGWGFARALRERGRALKIVVLSAAQDAQRWAAEIQADGWVAKPFELPDLLAAVERFCG